MNWIEKSWYQQGKLVYVLAPLSLLFWLISSLRRWLFSLGIKKQTQASKPVIVVGNISVGGTGKTPFVIYLCQLLTQKGLKVGIVSRGYGADKKGADNSELEAFPRHITKDTPVNLSGDEPKLLAMKTNCPVVIDSNRPAAIQSLISNYNIDLIISDDGLQHYQMAREVEFVLVDGKRKFGNGWLLPTGPLRELPSRLNSVDLVIENQGMLKKRISPKDTTQTGDYTLAAGDIYQLQNPSNILAIKQINKVHLISGIGNPQRFVDTVTSLGLSIQSQHWFADHHDFSQEDFADINKLCTNDEIVLMTEKDAVKCQHFAQDNWYVLPISAHISQVLEQQILSVVESVLKKQN